ncbi:DUF4358 domain-containing protein [Bengtsoniella intestinalis]|uniref:DUF4358 domain-containing protein n=1 Tax=Bengtsoniella intestinalis TaxID=3073143 RepID=UPI00391F988D
MAPETPVTPEVTEPEAPATADVTAQSLFETLTAAGVEFPALSLVEGEFLDMTYAGLADASSDFVVYMPMMSAVAAEIAIAKTDGTSTVAELFNARVEYQKTSGAFYPAEIEGWASNSHVVTAGDYVMLLVLPVEAAQDAQTLIDLFTTTVG